MRSRHALCAVAAIFLVSTAEARSRKLQGSVRGDGNSRVTMKIIIRGDQPAKVKRFKFTRLNHACTDGAVDEEVNGRYRGSLRIVSLRGTGFRFFGTRNTPSGRPLPNILFVNGRLKGNARKVRGQIANTIRFPSGLPAGETACTSGPGPATANGLVNYTARARGGR